MATWLSAYRYTHKRNGNRKALKETQNMHTKLISFLLDFFFCCQIIPIKLLLIVLQFQILYHLKSSSTGHWGDFCLYLQVLIPMVVPVYCLFPMSGYLCCVFLDLCADGWCVRSWKVKQMDDFIYYLLLWVTTTLSPHQGRRQECNWAC